ncbi:MAG: hypothetical protein M3Y77_07155 [Actinomycetota bacterium]|nr:hypothetical protein [Actinomycetota bacterium]
MSAQPSENAAAASVAESVATQPIRALLLDLDDTLIDTRAAVVAAATHAAGELWPELPADVAAEFGLLHYTDPARNFELYADGVVTFDEMRLARYDHARAVFGVAATDGGVDRFERLYGTQLRRSPRVLVRPAGGRPRRRCGRLVERGRHAPGLMARSDAAASAFRGSRVIVGAGR